MLNKPLKIRIDVKPAGASVEDVPLTITENGIKETPKGIRYNPITVDVKTEDLPLTITENGTTEAPDGVRYTPITVAVPKPTLNAPLISVSVLYGKVVVDKSINGEFPKEYLLYINGEQKAVSTDSVIPLNDYITSENAQIQVKCRNDEYFNESDFSNTIDWDIAVSGTAGLEYSGNGCTGIGTATAKTLYVASIVNSTEITRVGGSGFNSSKDITLILPDTVTTISWNGFIGCTNLTIVAGANIDLIQNSALTNTSGILDFRKATKIPTAESAAFNQIKLTKIVVPDNLFEEWVVATNWSAVASKIIRATDYEAQGGAV